MSSPTGRNVPPYRPPFHELPRAYGGKLAEVLVQTVQAQHMERARALRLVELERQGWKISRVWDEVLITPPADGTAPPYCADD
jgi:hypothetical protein